MHRSPIVPRWSFAAMAVCLAAQAMAQGQATSPPSCERTRAEVRAECRAFLRTHRWDEAKGDYVATAPGKAASRPPEGVPTRAQMRAARDAFMKANRWNEALGAWEPVGGAPRDPSKLTRDEVRKETQAFMRTHRWDEVTESYVELRPAKPK